MNFILLFLIQLLTLICIWRVNCHWKSRQNIYYNTRTNPRSKSGTGKHPSKNIDKLLFAQLNIYSLGHKLNLLVCNWEKSWYTNNFGNKDYSLDTEILYRVFRLNLCKKKRLICRYYTPNKGLSISRLKNIWK